jgi:hypothetical protein
LESYYCSNTSDDTAGSDPARLFEEISKNFKFVSGSSMLGFIEPLILVPNKSLIKSTLLAGFPRKKNDWVGKRTVLQWLEKKLRGMSLLKHFPTETRFGY